MKTLTVFTPTYNRKHTLPRTFASLCRQTSDDFEWLIVDDGSIDGTREWVESLGTKTRGTGRKFDWMGRCMEGEEDERSFSLLVSLPGKPEPLTIHYVYKENGGLYTGYNTAYSIMKTELCVCIDSDDYMPDDAVEKILKCWGKRLEDKEYCGLVGLDYNVVNGMPIGGFFPTGVHELFFHDMRLKNLHSGDTKLVMRTALMKNVAPMEGFMGEKNFNPVYMLMQVCDQYPLIVLNENLCWVEYQLGLDSMSQGIYRQYVNSPRSFAKMRLLEMSLVHNLTKDRFRSCVHYVSSCLICKDKEWLTRSPLKMMTLLAAPLGFIWYCFILYKNRNL